MEYIDWDLEVGHWIKDVPYVWKPPKDNSSWRGGQRRYLVRPGAIDILSDDRCKDKDVMKYFMTSLRILPGQTVRINGYPILTHPSVKKSIDVDKYRFGTHSLKGNIVTSAIDRVNSKSLIIPSLEGIDITDDIINDVVGGFGDSLLIPQLFAKVKPSKADMNDYLNHAIHSLNVPAVKMILDHGVKPQSPWSGEAIYGKSQDILVDDDWDNVKIIAGMVISAADNDIAIFITKTILGNLSYNFRYYHDDIYRERFQDMMGWLDSYGLILPEIKRKIDNII